MEYGPYSMAIKVSSHKVFESVRHREDRMS